MGDDVNIKMPSKGKLMLGLIVIVLIIGVFGIYKIGSGISSSATDIPKIGATIYKSESCGCCGNFVQGLSSKKYDINIINLDNLDSIKQRYNIPANMQSCHTTIIGDYFIEGHMPYEVIEKLLTEKPNIDGLALPGMPSGSPGMPGAKTEPFAIYAITNGEATEYMSF